MSEQKSPNRINSKEQKSVAGNWGHPSKFEKKMTKIPDPFYPEKPTPAKKKKKKNKKPYLSPWKTCPFCKSELPEKPKPKEGKTPGYRVFRWFHDVVEVCPECGAYKVEDGCPSCGRDAWRNTEGVYKHMWMGCGFSGRKKFKDGKPYKLKS